MEISVKVGPLKNLSGCFLFLLLLIASLHAQRENIRFQHLTLEDGLSQGTVRGLVQDRDGFMWFGTEDGLNKYDGNKFITYRNIPGDSTSLIGNIIYFLFEDRLGKMWIGTISGLSCYDREKDSFISYTNKKGDSTSLSENHVLKIYEDKEGTLWIGTNKGGLNKFNRKSQTFTRFLSGRNAITLSDNVVNSLLEDSQGDFWVGTANGLNLMDRKEGNFKHYKNQPGNNSSLSDNCISDLVEDETGVWVGTCTGGLNRLNKKSGRFTRYLHQSDNPESLGGNSIYHLFRDSRNMLWVSIENHGVNRFDSKQGKFIQFLNNPKDPYSLADHYIYNIYEDREGILWFGCDFAGVDKLNVRNRVFKLYVSDMGFPDSLKFNLNRAIYEDLNGVLWIGSDGEGLMKMDREKNEYATYRHNPGEENSISSNFVFSIAEDSEENLWIGTWHGVNKFNRKTGKFTHYRHSLKNPKSLSHDIIRKVYIDRSGILWVGTYGGGLNWFNSKENNFVRYQLNPDDSNSISNDFVVSICEDRAGRLWIGTFGGGLNRYDRKHNKFIRYTMDEWDTTTISHNRIITIDESSTGGLWISTHGGGLNKFNTENEIFTRYRNQLPVEVVYAAMDDLAGNVWVSGNRGITKFNPVTGAVINYQKGDGIQSNEFNSGAYYKSSSGEMFFGGVKGFNSFFPEQIKINETIPKIKIIDFQLFNKSVPVGREKNGRVILNSTITHTRKISLRHDENFLSFEFVSLSFTAPKLNQYAIIMEGLEKEWNYVGNRRFVTYSGLKPGDYVFRVRGSNNNGVWNEEGASIKLTIQAPFWATWWFRLLMGAVLAGIVLLIFKGRLMVLRHKLEQQRLGRELKLKSDFTAMLVHDLRNPLSALSGYGEIMIFKNLDPYITKAGKTIKKASNMMISLINDMLDVYKFEANKMSINKHDVIIEDIFRETEALMQPLFDEKNIRVESNIQTREKIKADGGQLARVINNLLANAIKFSPQNGVIKVSIEQILKSNKMYQEFAVEDDGKGIEPEKQKLLFNPYSQLEDEEGNLPKGTGLGLAVTKLTIEAHGGKIGYRDGSPGGSVFYFCIPENDK